MSELGGEQEPVITLEFEDGRVELPRSRASVYTFLGREALSHIFLRDDEKSTEDINRGAFIWRDKIGERSFDTAMLHMIRLGYYAVLNSQTVSEGDQLAYYGMHPATDLPDLGVSDEVEKWLSEQ